MHDVLGGSSVGIGGVFGVGGFEFIADSLDEQNRVIGAKPDVRVVFVFVVDVRHAVAVIVILISIIPVYLAHRLSSDEGGVTGGKGGGAADIAEVTAAP